MSQSAAIKSSTAKPRLRIPVEQRLYAISPLGTLATTLIIFVLLYGSFLGLAALGHLPTIEWTDHSFALHSGAWPALILSLLCCTVLGIQRYNRAKEISETARYAAVLKGGLAQAEDMTWWMPKDANLKAATSLGFIFGLAIAAIILLSENDSVSYGDYAGTAVWFLTVITLLIMSFARGVEMSRKGTLSYMRHLESDLIIDLLRIDRLSVLGRAAARGSLIWFAVSAIVCLFFVGGQPIGFSLALLVACAAMGLWMFVRIMAHIHHKIHAAKAAELERIRQGIDRARAQVASDPAAPARLQSLLAYETRIADVREWPFDQSTAVRVAAYLLIPAIPWFGQAVVQYLVEHSM